MYARFMVGGFEKVLTIENKTIKQEITEPEIEH
jgi:hypothetical protein